MDVIYSLIPGMIFFGLVFVGVLIWAIKRGQYEDLEGDGNRILMDEDGDQDKPLEPGERRKRVGLNFPDDD
ncbi:cbb3-type cytochrome oxidase assembly protein CcoS [Thiolapillus brandeum]|uniref:Cb-type cytochrome oxidase maturation protein n=1 Tax=Thiolapillus brandeum TaxID=1076588 RepID=A0A7U6JI91_9GAMM|nr:cbb3-type cytochrome oxidase assembly protein CcoS [Thiolapillus brandeum]BAO44587.1 cb-type cytochrome oxidase maturation protein [Thiolapillus brandeum]